MPETIGLSGPVTRILLRYASGALVTWGLLSAGLADQMAHDPDVMVVAEVSLGIAIGAAVEGYYWAARRYGWST